MGTLKSAVLTPEPNTMPGSALVRENAVRTQFAERTK